MSARLVYDEDCRFCVVAAAAVLSLDRHRRLRPLALQDTDLPTDSWHLVDGRGHVNSAGGAVAPLLRLLPGGRLPAAFAAAMPHLTERAYRALAANRGLIGRRLPDELVRRARRSVAQRLSL
ncbi:MAG: hypothetical protein NVSMB51_05000 [Solirubrobacteraceae bacterium]